ncbi:DNA pilot protein [Dipodfec virus UOA04_Rod_809]|nr:DNA pilot protein [Dipodfec virus UOA04_Rod_809]
MLNFLAGVGSMVTQGAVNSAFNKQNQKRVYNQQVDFWNMQNAYNHPAEQRRRLEEAGYNINGMNGGIDSGTASSSVPSAPANFSPASQTPLDAANLRLIDSQATKNIAEANRADRDAAVQESQASLNRSIDALQQTLKLGQDVTNKLQELRRQFEERTLDSRVEATNMQPELLRSKARLMNEEADYVVSRCIGQMNLNSVFGVRREIMTAELANIKARTELIKVEADLAQHNIFLTDARKELIIQQATDVALKNGSNYWQNTSAIMQRTYKQQVRDYNWAPALNAGKFLKSITGAVVDCASFFVPGGPAALKGAKGFSREFFSGDGETLGGYIQNNY